jgi:hypothetical protein
MLKYLMMQRLQVPPLTSAFGRTGGLQHKNNKPTNQDLEKDAEPLRAKL